jgi:putative ABC transport system permease protein
MNFWHDLRIGTRTWSQRPGLALVCILSLALGIGANTTVFSVVQAVLLHSLPYPEPDRLLLVSAESVKAHVSGIGISWTKYKAVRDSAQMLTPAAVYSTEFALASEGSPERVYGARVTASFLPVLGLPPAMGRNFTAQEEQPGSSAAVAIISHGLWQRRFGGDKGILGRTALIGGREVEIIGVLPASFAYNFADREFDVLVPDPTAVTTMTPAQIQNGAGFLFMVARMKPGATLDAARRELGMIDDDYGRQFPANVDATAYRLFPEPIRDSVIGDVRAPMLFLFAAVGLVLLIACANCASLLLARATARRGEMAIRRALGATFTRLAMQMLAESLVIAAAATAIGIAIAIWALAAVRATAPVDIPRLQSAAVSPAVLLFAAGLCIVTTLLVGAAPAVQGNRAQVGESLHGLRGATPQGANRVRAALVIGQIALSLMLVTGATLLLQSMLRLRGVDTGFGRSRVVMMRISLPRDRYKPDQQAALFTGLLDRVRTLPGIEAAGATSYEPFGGGIYGIYAFGEGHPRLGARGDPVIRVRHVSPDYFRSLGVGLLAGREFAASDTKNSAPVILINQKAVDLYWPGENGLGKHIASSGDSIQREVVGIIPNLKQNALNRDVEPELYFPYTQVPWSWMTLTLRTPVDAGAALAAVRRELDRFDRDQPITDVRTLDDQIFRSTARARFNAALTAVFAGLGLLLATVGIYAVMQYWVVQRTREIGIRMALGASRRTIGALVLRQGALLALMGIAAGIAGAIGSARLLATMLFSVAPRDPLTLLAVAAAFAGIAILASCLPAWKATRTDPMVALRME